MQRDQRVFEMAEEVLARQVRSLVNRTGQPFDRALEVFADTEAGRLLRELANGEHRCVKAQQWQANMLRERTEERLMRLVTSDTLSHFVAERPDSWVEGYMEWLEGKEARVPYHALLEELASLRG